MIRRVTTALAAAFLLLAPMASHADLVAYSQDFETLVQADPFALQNDKWIVYGNVFDSLHVHIYGYGAFPAPNPGGGFSAIDAGQGGVPQGLQQLSVYNDYNNVDHLTNRLIEANVYREQTIGLADVGSTWTFMFDAKIGNLAGATTALAFIKTLNPATGYSTTNIRTVDMTLLPATWGTFWFSLPIDASLVGQLLQFGFANTASHYEGSGVFYDNLSWVDHTPLDVAGTPRSNSLELRAAAPNPFSNSTQIQYAMTERGPVDVSVYDITGRRVATLFHGQAEPGSHMAIWNGRSADGRPAPTGVYRCVLQTLAGRQARSMVLSR